MRRSHTGQRIPQIPESSPARCEASPPTTTTTASYSGRLCVCVCVYKVVRQRHRVCSIYGRLTSFARQQQLLKTKAGLCSLILKGVNKVVTVGLPPGWHIPWCFILGGRAASSQLKTALNSDRCTGQTNQHLAPR